MLISRAIRIYTLSVYMSYDGQRLVYMYVRVEALSLVEKEKTYFDIRNKTYNFKLIFCSSSLFKEI